MIRPADSEDAEAIARIYNHYVTNTIITFEEDPVSAAEIAARIQEVHAANLPWFVEETADGILGYSYAGKWKTRTAYRYSVESTIYLDPAFIGRGLGLPLYTHLIGDLRSRDLHTVIGGIALPNASSIALHEKLGFQKIGQLAEVGWKFNRWIAVGYWQLLT
jgi:L-amino acid N-acyltransferase YncA